VRFKRDEFILCVDDEPNILSALQRLLNRNGYQVLTAAGGEAALDMLRNPPTPNPIAMIISDQLMPGMTGVELLRQVKESHPETIRIILTGHMDVESAIAAVNNGGMFRYLTKPWEDQDLLTTVDAGLLQYELVQQNRELNEQTQRHNAEVLQLNQALEKQVKELASRNQELAHLSDMLEKDLYESLAMLLRVMEIHDFRLVAKARRVAGYVKRIASMMSRPDSETRLLITAALLQDLGLMSVPHGILDKQEGLLSEVERALLQQHPQVSMEAVSHLGQLKPIAPIILAHHERYDGQGYPNKIIGEEIPLGARIIAVANGYDDVVAPCYGNPIPALEQDALKYLSSQRSRAFDPLIVDTFIRCVSGSAQQQRAISLTDLEEGMVLAQNIFSPQNTLLITKGVVLTLAMIKRLQGLGRGMRPETAAIVAQTGQFSDDAPMAARIEDA
jgi:response regulator RpfG family c-di-GMP phosphodiesterase